MKIIFLTTIPTIEQHLNDMYVDAITKFFEVEMWDLSKVYNRVDEMSHRMDSTKEIFSSEEFESELALLNGNALIITNTLFYSLKKIYPSIKKFGIDILTITKEGFCSNLYEQSKYSLMMQNGINDIARTIVKRSNVLRKTYNRISNGLVKFDYLMATDNYYPEYTDEFIKIHHVKYDEYLRNIESDAPVKGEYIIFLDSAVINHPMYKYSKRKPLNSYKYLNLLNNFFDELEKKYGKQVIISAHPKSSYSAEDFNGREIIKYQTAALIQNSSLVLSHYSTSVINAILAKKPLIFLYYSEMLITAPKHTAIGGIEFARSLESPLVDLERHKEYSININEEKYDDFIDKYILNNEKKDKTNEELIIEFLKHYDKTVVKKDVIK